jgi:hypothetical protein
MLTLSALLFASAVAAPRTWWTAPPPPEPKRPVVTAPDKPKPPAPIPLCKKHPHRCTVQDLTGPADDYQNGSADGGSAGGN